MLLEKTHGRVGDANRIVLVKSKELDPNGTTQSPGDHGFCLQGQISAIVGHGVQVLGAILYASPHVLLYFLVVSIQKLLRH